MQNLNKITIKNKSFGPVDGIIVYLTDDLFTELDTKKTREGGKLISLLEGGRLAKGLKHLLETLRVRSKGKKIVFTKQQTKTDASYWYINFDEYKSSVSGRFYALYREVGLDGALNYLSQKLPGDFTYDKDQVSASQINVISKKLPSVLKELEKKTKNKKTLLRNTVESINELKEEKNELKKEIVIIEEIRNASNIAFMQKSLNELEDRLSGARVYKETSGKDHWQGWVYKNNWMFGISYAAPIEKQKIGFDNIPDFIFPTIDGFIDILEIKLPAHDVIKKDDSHAGSFMWTNKTSEAIGQAVNYLHEIELNQLQIQKKIKENRQLDLLIIKPRVLILIGNSSTWNNSYKEGLRKLNYSLHGIEVITYTDLQNRAKQIVKLYEK